jgi:Fe2+ or Zn2+ uptake regulation protein
MERATIQRKVILDAIHALGHVKISELIDVLKKSFPTMSTATIYRNLITLNNEGMIRRISTKLDEDVYEDTSKDMHDHFICEECGIIIDIENNKDSDSYYDKDGNLIEQQSVTYYGVCRDCLNRKKS